MNMYVLVDVIANLQMIAFACRIPVLSSNPLAVPMYCVLSNCAKPWIGSQIEKY